MSARSRARSARILALLGGVLALVITGCGGYRPTPVPAPAESPALERPSASRETCDDATVSYQPQGAIPAPGRMPAGSTMREIAQRGRLIVGVSADTYLLGARNPATGRIEGFDVDLARSIADAIFGDPDKIELRVISAADRIPALTEERVDLVVRAMTMTCQRWEQVAFSAVYYEAGQKVLARTDSGIEAVNDLAGRTVCAPNGTSSIDNLLRRIPDAELITADNHTGCLLLFQSGAVDAITGDDTVLAGLAAQDPYARVLPGEPLSSEPYGMAMRSDDVDLVRFVNARLDRIRSDGEWQRAYNRWLAPDLGKASPPEAEYGR